MSVKSMPARLYVANRRAKPIVRTSGSRASLELGQDRGRLAVAGELVAQPAPGEERELPLLADVRLPQLACRDALDALPEARRPRSARRGRRGRRRGPRAARRSATPIQVGPWTPLVMPQDRPSVDALPGRVGRLRVELADGVRAVGQAQREGGHVELAGIAVRRRARARATRSTGHRPPPSRSGPATRRTRSASKRSLPAETGVWMVKTLFATDARPGVVERSARRRRARGPARRAGSAEWPSLRCQTAGAMPSARSARTPPTPRTSSWWSRISRPRTYRMLVIGRSASAFSGRVRVEQQDRHAADLGQPDGDRTGRARAARR